MRPSPRSYMVCLSLLALFLGAQAYGASIPVVYQGSIIEGQPGVDQGLPVFLSGSPNNVRFKFFVPNYASILSLSLVMVSVDVYDDGDANPGEQGEMQFVLNGAGLPNESLATFSNLNPYTSGSPFTLMGAPNLLDAELEVKGDGYFFLRVNRDGNDFFVTNPMVDLEGQLVPEPATFALAGCALCGIVWFRRRIH